MSKIRELYEKVSKDATLQERIDEILKDAEAAGQDATAAKLVEFAKNTGYDISIQEMQEFFQSFAAKKEGELSDLELDMVAGGKSTEGIMYVVGSVLSLGMTCAAVSLAGALKEFQRLGDNCASMFD